MVRALTTRILLSISIACLGAKVTEAQNFQLQTGWPEADGLVLTMALDSVNDVLYLGGTFTTIGGQPRVSLAAIDAHTGAVLSWAPTTDSAVISLLLSGDSVIVAGQFFHVNDQPRTSLAALDAATGALRPWAPAVTGPALGLLMHDSELRVCGSFTSVNGQSRISCASFALPGATLTAWAPTTNVSVRRMAANGSNVVLVGSFTMVNGVSKSYVAEVDGTTGALTDWAATVGGLSTSVLKTEDRVIVAGAYSTAGGQSFRGLSSFTPEDGTVQPWGTRVNGASNVMYRDGDLLFFGGIFTLMNDIPHTNLGVAFLSSGLPIQACPQVSSTVSSVVAHNGMLYVGGAFTMVDGNVPRSRLAVYTYCTPRMWYADADEDGLGDNGAMTIACDAPPGYVLDNTDCDDSDPDVGAPLVWYRDLDGDENGDHADGVIACTQPIGYADNSYDCDDSDPNILSSNACDDGDPYTTSDSTQPWPDCGCAGMSIVLSAKVLLEGPYDPTSGLMKDDLRAAGLIPLTEPYTAMGYVPAANVLPGAITDPAVLDVTGLDAIVDWVVLEVRHGADPALAVSTRYALVQRDGDIVEPDGVSPVRFPTPFGAYRVAVLHRNHMGVVTDANTYLENTAFDFTSPALSVHGGPDSRRQVAGQMLLWSGDTSFNDDIKYIGEGNDRDPILVVLGGSTPTATLSGYYNVDVNMNGVVSYVGENNDRDPILLTIGGNLPSNVRHNVYLRPTLP